MIVVVGRVAVGQVWNRVTGAIIAILLGLVLLGSAPGTAAATDSAHQSGSHDQRHTRTEKGPFCGKGIIPLNPAYSKPSTPKSTKASATLLPCYKPVLPSGLRTNRP
jgi:hypothetical protein